LLQVLEYRGKRTEDATRIRSMDWRGWQLVPVHNDARSRYLIINETAVIDLNIPQTFNNVRSTLRLLHSKTGVEEYEGYYSDIEHGTRLTVLMLQRTMVLFHCMLLLSKTVLRNAIRFWSLLPITSPVWAPYPKYLLCYEFVQTKQQRMRSKSQKRKNFNVHMWIVLFLTWNRQSKKVTASTSLL
jgi:hypothetical protein